MTELKRAAEEASSWLYGVAMPLWLEKGVDWEHGGFFESLTLEGARATADFKRLRVLTRQIFVFAEGARRGVDRSEAALEGGLEFLLRRAPHPDGGFASRFSLSGEIINSPRDLYDLAFTLFALAHGYRQTRDPRLVERASALRAFIEGRMAHPAGGFVESIPESTPRRQNPHMHLLEAALAAVEHMPEANFGYLADSLIELARARFIDAEAGLLFEYFDDALQQPVRDAFGRAVTEPGHHFEWAWLLDEHRRLRGAETREGAALADFALRRGFDAVQGLLLAEVYDDGSPADASVRLWPHGEWLKAALRLNGQAGDWRLAWSALRRFLDTPIPGLWFERWDAKNERFFTPPAPASSLYHITTAVLELERAAALEPDA